MIIFRPHRATLMEAMKEVKEFNDEQEMKEYIADKWSVYFSIDDIVIDEDAHTDNRIGWKDTRYVCVKRFGEEDFMKKHGHPQCLGMCATDY